MKKIPSFTVNHLNLLPGIYVSREDHIGNEILTTYDLRWKQPNVEPVMNTAEMHTIEHLAATFLRNHPTFADETIYFGPMGCRTGFYLILKGSRTSKEILPLIRDVFEFVAAYEGEVPGASAKDCGNYLDMNLPMAKYEAHHFVTTVLDQMSDDRLAYPS